MQARLFLVLTLLGFGFTGYGQSGVIEGQVFNKVNKEPLAYATVRVLDTEIGTITDSVGRFRMEVPPGLHNLEAAYVGFYTLIQHEIVASSAKPVKVGFPMEELVMELDVAVVKSGAFQQTSESPLSLQRINVHEIERLPGATLDVSKFVKALPGVSPRVSFGYNMIVRGGAATENRFYLDGIEIPTITHFTVQGTSGGPNGLINVKMLRNADFHTGAFPASRPNALSSVLELHQREGRTDKFGGNFTLGATDFGFLFEGPMGKKSSYMLSARESFSQHMLRALGIPVLPTYADVQYKQAIHFDQKNELIITGIGSYDKFELNLEADPSESLLYNVGYIPEGKQLLYAAGAVYKHYLENSFYTIVLSRNYLNSTAEKFLDNTYEVEDQTLDYRSVEAENKFRLEHKIISDNIEWEYGVNLEHDHIETQNSSIYTQQDGTIEVLDYDTDFQFVRYGFYGSYAHRFFDDELDFFAGVRIDGNTFNENMRNPLNQFSPRLALTWHATQQWNFNASAGIYYQLPPYVVMAYGEPGANGSELVNQENLKYMRSAQVGVGVDFNTKEGYQFKLEGFYKKYDDYPFLLLDSISLANANANYVLVGNQPADASSEGRAYGVEFSVKQKFRKSYFWMLNYTYVVSQFADVDGSFVSSSWDNRHIGSVALGKTFKKNWQVGIRWSLAGGSPYTPYDVELSGMKAVWDINRRGLPDYDRLNEARLPVFHQLDVRVDKQFNFNKWTMGFFIDLQNAYMSPIAALPYLTVQRSAEEFAPISDPSDPNRYLTTIISSDTGRLIPSLGIIIDF